MEATAHATERAQAFDVLWRILGVCPAYYQFDTITQEVLRVAKLRGEGAGYPVHDLPSWFVDYVLIASSTMADYSISKMPKPKGK